MYFRANENPNIFQHIFGIALVFFIKIPKKKDILVAKPEVLSFYYEKKNGKYFKDMCDVHTFDQLNNNHYKH